MAYAKDVTLIPSSAAQHPGAEDAAMKAKNAVLIIMKVMVGLFLIAATLIKIAVMTIVATLTYVKHVWM